MDSVIRMVDKQINVTKTFLPPIEEYQKYLQDIWGSGQLTNNGKYVRELEERLKEYLQVNSVSYVSSGTIALQIAIKALELEGEIITTPFSYVATTSSVVWEGCQPVFVDIDTSTLNIDPTKIEAAITSETTAILATHVYGNPCDVETIQNIADKHGLKVIYDAAHCFGVTYKGTSIFNYGDVSITSFHATKVFHTIEGGALFTKDKALEERIRWMRNFGHDGPEKFSGVGINGKNSELHAAMGLCNLKYVDSIIGDRKKIVEQYDRMLSEQFEQPHTVIDVSRNYAYYPIIFESETSLLEASKRLEQENIFARRYFYPSLNKLPYVNDQTSCTNSESISKRVLCLPLFKGLEDHEINKICEIILL